VLGYHWLIHALRPHLERAGTPESPARVVNVASNYAGGLDLADPEYKTRKYEVHGAYRASKQADRMLTAAWARRLDRHRVQIFSCHPGGAGSAVALGLGGPAVEENSAVAAAGAVTPLYLALDHNAVGHSGKFFDNKRPKSCPFATNIAAVERLWAVLEGYKGPTSEVEPSRSSS
jgi:NAD(P)-dependent dehydrogenase (short-subunit alcohol dehydrogenase family)